MEIDSLHALQMTEELVWELFTQAGPVGKHLCQFLWVNHLISNMNLHHMKHAQPKYLTQSYTGDTKPLLFEGFVVIGVEFSASGISMVPQLY